MKKPIPFAPLFLGAMIAAACVGADTQTQLPVSANSG
jgi:hypothetical protein